MAVQHTQAQTWFDRSLIMQFGINAFTLLGKSASKVNSYVNLALTASNVSARYFIFKERYPENHPFYNDVKITALLAISADVLAAGAISSLNLTDVMGSEWTTGCFLSVSMVKIIAEFLN